MTEYPKMLYRGTEDVPDTMIVDSAEMEALAIEDGWVLASQFFGFDVPTPEKKKKGKT
jgi:hypothetical protein